MDIDEMTMIIDLIVYDNGVAQWKMEKNINAQTKPNQIEPNQTERNGWNEKTVSSKKVDRIVNEEEIGIVLHHTLL